MSDYKTSEQTEFCDLFERLREHDGNITAKQVAAVVKLTPSQVSQILKGKRGTRPWNVEALRNYVNSVCGTEQGASPSRLHEGADVHTDLQMWRRRAKNAEAELHTIKDSLRAILARPNSNIQKLADREEVEIAGSVHSPHSPPP